MLRRPALLLLVASGALAAATACSAGASYADRVAGIEVPPITSSLGTFVGLAAGPLPGRWRVQIAHEPLRTGATVAITGGTFTMHPVGAAEIAAPVTGGSVAVVSPGAGCTDQRYAVSATLSVGSFAGTLVHHRHALLGRCVIYAATISGRATLTP